MTAAHILLRLTKGRKNDEEIAREDFNDNLELVSVWIDYMAAINWINKSDGKSSKWIATDNGKKWVQIILQNNMECEEAAAKTQEYRG
jgi:hypothetical protein